MPHSFKGNSAAMGFTHLSKFTHGLESAMEALRKEQRTLTPELATLLLQAVDMIRTLLERTRTEGDVGDPTCDSLLQQINAVINGETPPPVVAPSAPTTSSASTPAKPTETPATPQTPQYRITYQPAPTLSAEHDPLQLLTELQGIRAGHRVPIPRANPAVGNSSRPTPATVAGNSCTRRRLSLQSCARFWNWLPKARRCGLSL
jgi:two-component system chemotaxis sensor kinase CheA